MRVLDVVDDVMGLVVPDDPPGVVGLIKDLITLRNATECKLSAAAAHIERLGIAKKSGSTTSKLLQADGVAPAVTSRWLRIGTGLTGLDRTAGYFRDGFLSTEHVDAVVRGRAHVAARAGSEMVAEERPDIDRKLLSHAISGASPDEVGKAARKLGNQVSGNTGGPPASEDSAMNTMDFAVVDGRFVGKFDLDAVMGEKMRSALNVWSKPRPEPDGSEDRRSPAQRRADALHQLLDCGGGRTSAPAPRTEVIVTVPADEPDRASLRWMGPITEAAAAALACDSSITSVTLDGQEVPIHVSPPRRLFTGLLRKAIIIRDACCVKCGAPAEWSDCHHIVHWQEGGPTTLENGCL